jgi:two-component system cell cycle response regulator DivK
MASRICHHGSRRVSSQAVRPAVILVVEDNSANQLLVEAILLGRGFLVHFASSAPEALTSIADDRPDLILMDIQLPGQDGLSLTRQLKADPATASIRIVAVSALAMVGDRQLSLDAGCIGHITKPFDTRMLREQIAAFLLISPIPN